MTKAIFLDRDGVINRERDDWSFRIEDFEILDGVFDTLCELKKRGFRFIIVSNQSGIDLGLFSIAHVDAVHDYLIQKAGEKGIFFDEIYYCRHHPTVGKCICRKPDSLFFEKAIARFNIDIQKSYMIGDRDRDIEAGKKAGLKTIKVESNRPLSEILSMIKEY